MEMTVNQGIVFLVLLGLFCAVMFPVIIRANRKLTAEQRAAGREAGALEIFDMINDQGRRNDRNDAPDLADSSSSND